MDWVKSFSLKNVLILNSQQGLELKTKSCCEFILYCYQLKIRNCLGEDLKDILVKTQYQYRSYYFKPLLDVCMNDVDNIKLDSIDCIENHYIISVVEDYRCFNYWNSLLNLFFGKYMISGSTLVDFYEFTHVIFYSSNFGNNKFISQISLPLLKSIKDLTLHGIAISKKSKNWDLLREFYISLLIVDESEIPNISNWALEEDVMIKSKSGWLLSGGVNLDYYERNYNQLSFKERYSLFHTTLISDLLSKMILHHPLIQK